jgi:SAM-dependent methyltransferase
MGMGAWKWGHGNGDRFKSVPISARFRYGKVQQMTQGLTSLRKSGARDYQQHRYRSLDQAWVNRREQRIVERLLIDCRVIGGSLLDVPCGYGRFTPLFARLGITVTGVDMSLDMVHLAVENGALYGKGRWLCASIFDLPFADRTFDGVLCIRLLHHRYSVAERLRILSELARVSRQFVLISFYRFTPVHALARHWRGTRGRLEMMSFAQIQHLVQACGLQIQRVYSLLRFCHAQTFVVLRKTAAGLTSTT